MAQCSEHRYSISNPPRQFHQNLLAEPAFLEGDLQAKWVQPKGGRGGGPHPFWLDPFGWEVSLQKGRFTETVLVELQGPIADFLFEA